MALPDDTPGRRTADPEKVLDSRRWVALGVLLLVQFMLILDASAATIALPSIGSDLGFSRAGLTWVIDGYVLMAGGLLLLGGRLGDVLGRRRMFMAGVVVFGLSSLVCGVAQNPEQLVAARFVQGIGEALAAPAALGLIALLFTDRSERTKAIGLFGGISGLGGTAGPLLSGVLVEFASWRWIFLINIPVAVAALVLVPRLVSGGRPSGKWSSIDIPSSVGIVLAFTAIVFGAIEAATNPWTSLQVVGFISGGVALLAAVLVHQTRARDPLVPLHFFTDRTRLSANLVTVFFYAVFFSQFYFVTLYLQTVVGLSPLETGLSFLPFGITIGIGLSIATALVPRLGLRSVLVVGTSLAAVGVWLLSGITPDGSYVSDVLAGSLVLAFGSGLVLPCLQIGAVNAVTESDAGLASGVQQSLQQVAGAVGLAVLVSLAIGRSDGSGLEPAAATVDGYQLAFTVGTAILVVAAVTSFVVPRGASRA
ncbi:MFS transporter [Rhodococcoides yunnanense]|uniref:MFS transporter n=1 Tax=Rhodococcoides yunnanense TaxID=278209 RepID=A0ABU4BGB4_9NOCA|nr:MFS transporter [Rhodococcus yunnanensis]MDV6263124.1 MFS transporter [Rhodococcus yunnanensis]